MHQKNTKKQQKSSKVDKLPTKVGRKIVNIILKFLYDNRNFRR